MVATVVVRLPGSPPDPAAHRRVVITGYNGRVPLELVGATSGEVELDNVAAEWIEVQRPGRAPLLEYGASRLRRISLEVILQRGDPATVSCESDLLVLAGFADSNASVLLTYAPMEASKYVTRSGRWSIVDMRVRSLRRRQGDNAVTRARVTLELVEYAPAEPQALVGPPPASPTTTTTATGAATPTAGAPTSSSTPQTAGRTARRHTVAAGETLWGLAARYYGDGNLWGRLAEANGIRDPRRLTIGAVLTIPG